MPTPGMFFALRPVKSRPNSSCVTANLKLGLETRLICRSTGTPSRYLCETQSFRVLTGNEANEVGSGDWGLPRDRLDISPCRRRMEVMASAD